MNRQHAAFDSAATSFASLVRQIPSSRWEDTGLGEWTVRDLVGHTSRSLTTVSTYLKAPAQREDLASATDYYVRMHEYSTHLGAAAIVERGRRAGRELGPDPAAAVDALVAQVAAQLRHVGNPVIEVIGGLGIRLDNYLPTRTFELTVHGMDIARAVGLDVVPPADALAETAALAARIGVALGHGPTLVAALTGREQLPAAFSVV